MGNEIQRSNDIIIDQLEAAMVDNFDPVNCPLEHLFTPGIYVRSIFMPRDIAVTSLIHKTCHPYIVSQGLVSVFVDGKDSILIKSPYAGITLSGTRRVLRVWEDTIWSTVHHLDFITGEENEWSDEEKEKLIAKIDSVIIEQHENVLLGGVVKNNKLIKSIENGNILEGEVEEYLLRNGFLCSQNSNTFIKIEPSGSEFELMNLGRNSWQCHKYTKGRGSLRVLFSCFKIESVKELKYFFGKNSVLNISNLLNE